MTYERDIEDRISLWMEEEAAARFPGRLLRATFEETGRRRQVGPSRWWTLPTFRLSGSLAAVGAAAVVIVLGALLLRTLPGQFGVGPGASQPADPRSAFLGTWISTSDADGGTQTMTVERADNIAVEVMVTDTIAAVCSLVPSTMTATGTVESNKLVLPTPDYRCDDGSEPVAISGPPLAVQLRNLTFVHDLEAQTLTDNLGGFWLRNAAQASSPAPQPSAQVAPPSDAEVTELLNGFLDARVAGEGAELYLIDPVPLLYSTSSGASYERAEFEQVRGVEWPYDLWAFKVRLFAGDTVVEQLVFVPTDVRPLALGYARDGFATDIAPTTEDNQPLAELYRYFGGEVVLRAAHPWVFHDGWAGGRLIPAGTGVEPTTDAGQRNDWDELILMADPALVGTSCQVVPDPGDAEALAESIRSEQGFEATAPVAVSAGGTKGLLMDVMIPAGATIPLVVDGWGDLCANGLLNPLQDGDGGYSSLGGVATGEWMRLYLFDLPQGSSISTLAIAIVAPESTFQRAVELAEPIVTSDWYRP